MANIDRFMDVFGLSEPAVEGLTPLNCDVGLNIIQPAWLISYRAGLTYAQYTLMT